MTKLNEGRIVQILPEYFKESVEVQALGYAVGRAVEKLVRYCENIGVFAVIDGASDHILDRLALELNTQYYSDDLPIQAKRELIKSTLIWYGSAGTPQAVEELVTAIFGKGEVQEWFEYGDEPYYFKITTNAEMTVEMFDKFLSMLQYIKNGRSWLRAMEFLREIQGGKIHTGVVLTSCGTVPVESMYYQTAFERTEIVCHAALSTYTRNYIFTEEVKDYGNV